MLGKPREYARRVPWALALATCLASSLARAEDETPEAEEAPVDDALTPPEPLATPLEYPEGETVIAEVTLELTIDAEGGVLDARVLEGVAPFSEAARTSALSWRFVPAKRGIRPVPARIRYGIRFEPPEEEQPEEEVLDAPRARDGGQAQAPKKPRPAPPIEITVSGERRPLGAVTITREDARAIPGTFGDPLRAIEAAPGVVPVVSGLPAFFIRGAPPSNVGFFVDGVDIPLLYHAFLGPSVLHPAMIAGIEFFPGAAPVSFGRFAGPVIAVRPRPVDTRFRLEGSLRTIDAGAFAEGPVFGCKQDDERDCAGEGARVAARYSYTGLILSALGDAKLDYWDYLVEVKRAVGPKDSVGILAFGAYDFFSAGGASVNSGGELLFHRVDARWDRRLGARSGLRVAVTGGYDRSGGATEDSSVVSDPSVRGRVAFSHETEAGHRIEAGADARADFYSLETRQFTRYAHFATLFPPRQDFVVGAYLSTELAVARGIRVAPGVRVDVYRSEGVTVVGVDPRVSAEFEVTRRLRFEHSLGIARQRPNFAAQVPGAQVADLSRGLQWALLASSTMRLRLPADFSASAGVFRNAYFNALDPIGDARDFTIDRSTIDRRSTIAAAGLELQLSRPLSHRFGGFISYTLSRSQTSYSRVKMPSGFDRTHVFQAALGYDFGGGYRAASRVVFYTGIPALQLEGEGHFTGERRGTPFFRVDLRGEKRWSLGNGAYIGLVAEVMNATSTREVVRLDCGEICRERVSGPVILPNIGIEAGL